jgi:hypothetical protein
MDERSRRGNLSKAFAKALDGLRSPNNTCTFFVRAIGHVWIFVYKQEIAYNFAW